MVHALLFRNAIALLARTPGRYDYSEERQAPILLEMLDPKAPNSRVD